MTRKTTNRILRPPDAILERVILKRACPESLTISWAVIFELSTRILGVYLGPRHNVMTQQSLLNWWSSPDHISPGPRFHKRGPAFHDQDPAICRQIQVLVSMMRGVGHDRAQILETWGWPLIPKLRG